MSRNDISELTMEETIRVLEQLITILEADKVLNKSVQARLVDELQKEKLNLIAPNSDSEQALTQALTHALTHAKETIQRLRETWTNYYVESHPTFKQLMALDELLELRRQAIEKEAKEIQGMQLDAQRLLDLPDTKVLIPEHIDALNWIITLIETSRNKILSDPLLLAHIPMIEGILEIRRQLQRELAKVETEMEKLLGLPNKDATIAKEDISLLEAMRERIKDIRNDIPQAIRDGTLSAGRCNRYQHEVDMIKVRQQLQEQRIRDEVTRTAMLTNCNNTGQVVSAPPAPPHAAVASNADSTTKTAQEHQDQS